MKPKVFPEFPRSQSRGEPAMRSLWFSLTCLLLTSLPGLGRASDSDVLRNIDRRIPKEPKYNATRPLYGLLAFGPAAQKPAWMVLDRSKPDSDRYDLLYVDLNANGDLTESAERVVGESEGNEVRFEMPDLKDPVTGAAHTQFGIRVSGDAPTVMVSMMWRGHFKMGGGYPQEPDHGGYMKFGDKPADAPVLWADGDSPFRFQRWYSATLPIGGQDDFKVFVGQPGVGESSFWAFQVHFLPEAEGVKATLIYHDGQNKEERVVCLLKERC
jgi:hypothetical protein